MDNDSTTDATVDRLTEAEKDLFDKLIEGLHHEALIGGSQRVLVLCNELRDFRETLTGESQDY